MLVERVEQVIVLGAETAPEHEDWQRGGAERLQ
jgi:hypothetical protein